MKIPLPSADVPNWAEGDIPVENPEKVLLLPPPADKPTEKQEKNLDHIEEAAARQFLAKQEVVKDLMSEISCPPKDSSDDPQT